MEGAALALGISTLQFFSHCDCRHNTMLNRRLPRMTTAYGFRPASPRVTLIDCLYAIDLPPAGSFPGAARLTRCVDGSRLLTNVAGLLGYTPKRLPSRSCGVATSRFRSGRSRRDSVLVSSKLPGAFGRCADRGHNRVAEAPGL
jgi:hypothetical protein